MHYLLVSLGITLSYYVVTRLAGTVATWIYEVVDQDEPRRIGSSFARADRPARALGSLAEHNVAQHLGRP